MDKYAEKVLYIMNKYAENILYIMDSYTEKVLYSPTFGSKVKKIHR